MNIWEMTGVMNAGGAETLIMELLRHKPSDANIHLVLHSANDDYSGVFDDEIKRLGIPVAYLPSLGRVGIKQYVANFKKLTQAIGCPDIVHSHLNAVGGFIAMAAKSCGIPHRIIHCHADITYHGSLWQKTKSEIGLSIMKVVVNHFGNHFWACSENAARRLFYKSKKTTTIPNAINVNAFINSAQKRKEERERLGVSSECLLVGAVGRIAPIKNYGVILRAMSKLIGQGCNVRFVCYGRPMDEEYYQELGRQVIHLNLKDYVLFLGNCSRVPEAISAFDAFVMPSITEGLGISALEAQAASLPTLLSTGIPPETDVGLDLIQRISPDDVDGWANAISSCKRRFIPEQKIKDAFARCGYDSEIECNIIYHFFRRMVEGDELENDLK